MNLPRGEDAIIDPRKISEYVLDPDHEEGKHKAALFRSLLGLEAVHAGRLEAALRKAAAEGEAKEGKKDRYGRRFAVDFTLEGPKGVRTIRSAWIIRQGEDAPRFVTCYIL